MQFATLDTTDHARALIDLVYSTYGLTFHRDYVYNPERLLELNRREHMRSFIALDGSTVVGHLAWIRPFFELARGGEPISDPRVGEAGLSIVRPEYRSQHVQTGLAITLRQWAGARPASAPGASGGSSGVFMKCVTNHTYSQRTSAGLGGQPLALFLAGVPKWVVYDDAPGERRDPISTLLYYVVLGPQPPATLRLPAGAEWIAEAVAWSGLERTVLPDDGAPETPEERARPTDLELEFQPTKHIAQVHVLHAGPDFEARVHQINRWLIDGHMKHVSWFLPADSRRVQRAGSGLAASGLFPGGWVPGLHGGGRDVLVYQSIAYQELDTDALQCHSPEAGRLRDHVAAAWRAAQAGALEKAAATEAARPRPAG